MTSPHEPSADERMVVNAALDTRSALRRADPQDVRDAFARGGTEHDDTE